jgi:hypothetical protein
VSIHTKNGQPLQQRGDLFYSARGAVVGRRKGGKVFGTDGRYVGTVVGDRLVFRAWDGAGIGGAFVAAAIGGSGMAAAGASALHGDEPAIAD